MVEYRGVCKQETLWWTSERVFTYLSPTKYERGKENRIPMGKGLKKEIWQAPQKIEEILEALYNIEDFGYLNDSHKLEVKLLEEKKRGISYWRKRKNGVSR